MAIEIKPYPEDLVPAVRAFNQRLKAGGVVYQFPERSVPKWLPKIEGRKIFQEYFVAVENGSEVRGTFILKHQEFAFAGNPVSIADYHLPISEGLVNKAYGLTGVQLLMNALKRQPLLFSLGIGGHEEALAQMLKRLGWTIVAVPFFFKVHHPVKFFRNIAFLRRSKLKRTLSDALAFSGAGWMGVKLGHLLLRKGRSSRELLRAENTEDFSAWTDELWNACKHQYALCAVRDRETLNILYPPAKKRFIRLKIFRGEKMIGWVVLLNTQMSNSGHFGNMKIGSIVDCLALREDAGDVMRMAVRHLESAGADMIVSNQLDAAWGRALKECGFLSGPSNYLFAASKKLIELLQPFEANQKTIHMTRGDGDGPINL